MRSDRVRKIDYVYLLGYILAPAALSALALWAGRAFFWGDSEWAQLLDTVPLLLTILLWAFSGRIVYRIAQWRMRRRLDGAGFDYRQSFYGESCVVAVDMEQAKVAMLFFWSPFALYVLPASRVTRAWVDEGVGGRGILRGTSRVSFLFEVDGVKVRVNTFVSNQRWRLDDVRVLEGISKADQWVQVLDQVRQREVNV